MLREIGIRIRQVTILGRSTAYLYDLGCRIKVESSTEQIDDIPKMCRQDSSSFPIGQGRVSGPGNLISVAIQAIESAIAATTGSSESQVRKKRPSQQQQLPDTVSTVDTFDEPQDDTFPQLPNVTGQILKWAYNEDLATLWEWLTPYVLSEDRARTEREF